jgi:hypothetical protein
MPIMKLIRYALLGFVAVAAVFVIRDIACSLPRAKHDDSGHPPAAESISVPSTGAKGTPYWQARHETGDLEEYSWWHIEGVPTGTLKVIPDPTGSGRGSVLRGEITSAAPPGGDSHRIYPALLLPECYRGGYRSSFLVWADLPSPAQRGWISFATYSHKKEWKDLFGVNLGFEQGEDRLVLFHVPVFSKGTFTRISSIPFPMRQWVKVEVTVDDSGIMLFQDDRLIAEAKKEWGAEGVGLCEAHWGLYGQDKNRSGLLLNDDITVNLDTRFDKPPRMVRVQTKGKP